VLAAKDPESLPTLLDAALGTVADVRDSDSVSSAAAVR
jgi:hypothetical protein